MPDCGGLITDLGLALPTAFLTEKGPAGGRAGSQLLAPISNLLSSLPDQLSVHIFVDRAALNGAKRWLDGLILTCQVSLVPAGSNVGAIKSPWIQDQISVRKRRAHGLESEEIVARTNDVLALAMTSHLSMDFLLDDLAVPGGNQLVGQEFRLVGSSELGQRRFGSGHSHDTTDLWRKISAMDDRRVCWFGYRVEDLRLGSNLGARGSWGGRLPSYLPRDAAGQCSFAPDRIHQCGFHVDQYVSVTGLSIDGRPLLLVAEPSTLEPDGNRACESLKKQLDASALLLEDQGFVVQRNPVPLVVAADTGKRLPRLYNNVLLENGLRPGLNRPQVWVPQFGDQEALEDFDRCNLAIWQRLGFDPLPVPGWSRLSSRNGAIRCVTKVLRRKELLQQGKSSITAGPV